MRSLVDHQPTVASRNSAAMSWSWDRAGPAARARSVALIRSGSPGELGLREPGLALVLDAEGADARALRLGHRQIGAHGMEHALEAHRLTGLDAEGHDVLDLEIDPVPDPDRVPHSVVLHLDRDALDPEHLADEGGETRHRAAELAAEDPDQLLRLLIRSGLVDEDAHAPLAVGHHLRRIGDQRDPRAAD